MRCESVYFYFQQRYLNNTNLILKQVLSSPDSSSPAGSDETDLATSGCSSLDGGSLTNMLVVTSSVGMLNGIHSNTTNLGPGVPLGLVLVVSTTSLQHGLVNPSTAGNDSDHGAVSGGDDLLASRGHLHSGPLGVGVVGNNGSVVTGCPGDLSSVPSLLLEVADNGSLGHVANGHHVADGEVSLTSTVDELTGVHALGSNHQLLLCLVPVGILEAGDGKGSTTARVVDDVLDDSLDVTVPLGIVNRPQGGLALSVVCVGNKHGPRTLSLGTDNTTHLS